MKKFAIFAVVIWVAAAAYAADFDRQLSIDVKGLKVAAASPAGRVGAAAARGLVCSPLGDTLADVALDAAAMRVTYLSGESETYFFDDNRPFVLDTPVSVFFAKKPDSQNFMGIWDKAVLFGIVGYGPGTDVRAELAMGGMVYPLKCRRR